MKELTEKKFLSLTVPQQHKIQANLLRKIYLSPDSPSLIKEHQTYTAWQSLPSLSSYTPKTISDRYHEHIVHTNTPNLLPPVRTKDRQHPKAPPLPIAIYLDNIRSGHNVESILRTIEAFSLGTAHFSPKTPFIDNKKVIDTAMGAEKWVNCSRAVPLSDLPTPLIALETSDHASPLHTFTFPSSFTLAIGNEEYGCSDEVLSRATHIVEIPLWGRKNSLNVANAFAIVAASIRNQRI